MIPFTNASFPYFGTKIGSLKRLHHGVSGDVYAVDSRTIFVKKFNYDGEAPGKKEIYIYYIIQNLNINCIKTFYTRDIIYFDFS